MKSKIRAKSSPKTPPKRRFDAFDIKNILLLAGLLLFSFSINTIALDWGCSGYVSWQPDSIEGVVTLSQMPSTFSNWTFKYPRGQFLINDLLYYPIIQEWKKKPVAVPTSANQMSWTAFTNERLKSLSKITCWITFMMSLGCVLATYLTSRALFKDSIAGLLAGLSLSVMGIFCFYATTGCVDIPGFFWFCWAAWAAVRAVQTKHWRYFLIFGFCSAYSVGTKEGQAMYSVGLVLGMFALHIEQQSREDKSFLYAARTFLNFKLLAAGITALTIFLFLNGFFWNGSHEFVTRMEHWKGVVQKEFLPNFTSYWSLLKTSYDSLYWGLGWPLLYTTMASIVYIIWRYPIKFIFLAAPLVVFYLFTVLNIRFVVERFLLGGYLAFAIMTGKMFADGFRQKNHVRFVITPVAAAAFILSGMYCLAIRLEMRSDTRLRTEQWFYQNVTRDKTIGAVMSRNYGPRMIYEGYLQYNNWVSADSGIPQGMPNRPDYLVFSNTWPCQGSGQDTEFRKQVYAGKTEYFQVAKFDPLYLGPCQHILTIAAWPRDRHSFLSPTIFIFKKTNSPVK